MNAKTVCSISVLAVALTLGAIPGWAQSDAVTVWSRIAPLDNVCPPSQAQKDLSDFGPPGRPLVSCPSEY